MAAEVRRSEYFVGVNAEVLVRKLLRWDRSAPAPTVLPQVDLHSFLVEGLAEVPEMLNITPEEIAEDRAIKAAYWRLRLRATA